MNETYHISTVTKVLNVLMATVFFMCSIFLFSRQNNSNHNIVLLMGTGCLAVSFLFLFALKRRKIEIGESEIKSVNIFSSRQMNLADIRGYRFEAGYIIIESRKPGERRMCINNYTDFENYSVLTEWIKNNFTDLNAADVESERQQFLENEGGGNPQASLGKKWSTAELLASVYNVMGGLLMFMMLTVGSNAFLKIAVFYPLLSIVLMGSNKWIKFITDRSRTTSWCLVWGIFLSSFMLFLISFRQYTLFQLNNLWMTSIEVAAVFFVVLYQTGLNRAIPVKSQLFIMAIVALMYGFGSVCAVNCVFDKSEPQKFIAAVLHRRSYGGKEKYLELSAWGPQKKIREVEVGGRIYYSVQVGDSVQLELRQGVLHIPWYKILQYQVAAPVQGINK